MAKPSKEFVDLLTALSAGFGKEADEPMFVAYWIAAADVPPADFRKAIERAVRECKFMPSPAELRELAGVACPADQAVLAWGVFQQAVTQYGAYRSVDFADKAINATVRSLGGWIRVCELPAEEFDKWLRPTFERVYASLARTGAGGGQGGYLVGYYEKENAKAGHAVAPPVMIGTGEASKRLTNKKPAGVPLVEFKKVK